MINSSITLATVTVATGLIALTSSTISVASPIIESISAPVTTPTATTEISPSPTTTAKPSSEQGSSSGTGNPNLKEWPNQNVGNGVMLHDLPEGIHASVNGSGVVFSYSGPCRARDTRLIVRGNNGREQSSGGSRECQSSVRTGTTYITSQVIWDEYIRNAYCFSPNPTSAYRGEYMGLTTEWIPMPEHLKNCGNSQTPSSSSPTTSTPPPTQSPNTPAAPPVSPTDAPTSPTAPPTEDTNTQSFTPATE